jgi:hypothetical protein
MLLCFGSFLLLIFRQTDPQFYPALFSQKLDLNRHDPLTDALAYNLVLEEG